MKSSRMFLIAAVPALALAAFLGRSTAQSTTAPAAPAVTRVAVCDVAAVFNDYQRAKDLNTQLSEKHALIIAEDKQRIEHLRQIRKELEELQPGSKLYDAKSAELERLLLERPVRKKLQDQALSRWHRRLTEDMYREILTTIAAVAKQRGYDLVIYRENVQIASQSTLELLDKILLRKCLYYNPAIDLTDAVLQRVNNQYGKRPK